MNLLSLLLIICCFLFDVGSSDAFAPPPPITTTTSAAHNTRRTASALFAKKKTAAAAKKIQVKMLKDVPGTGQKHDVIQVTPAFFQNKLRPTKSAEVISDEEVEREELEKAAALAEERQEATEVKEMLDGTTINIVRKAGPDGQLFGGISPKNIMEEVRKQVQDHAEFLSRKGVKIVAVTDDQGKKMRQDIKHIGDFGAQVTLAKDISFTVKISVQADE